jgi:Tol biopolymer transport system component
MLLPVRACTAVRVETGLQQITTAAWFRDGKQVVFGANQKGHKPRTYVQQIDGGSPRPVTPEGELFVAFSPDSEEVFARGPNGFSLYPVSGAVRRSLRSIGSQDIVASFASGGKAIYLQTRSDRSRVFRLDLASGRREISREIHPSDQSAMRMLRDIRITLDGKSIAFVTHRTISELYLVEGLK